ncbi:MAG: hypothetical protein ABIU63_03040 [Chitinophagaceae bacterium]
MHAPFDNIVQHLFHQPSLLSVTVDELERMAQQHPYFAAAHFLLLKKMQDTDHPAFTAQLHKTTLYFNNPLWLQFLLQPETVHTFKVSDQAPFIFNDANNDAAEASNNDLNNGIEEYNSTHPADALAPPDLQHDNIEALQENAEQSAVEPAHRGIMDVISAVFSEPAIDDTRQQNGHAEFGEAIPAELADNNTVSPPVAINEEYGAEHILAQPDAGDSDATDAAGDDILYTGDPVAVNEMADNDAAPDDEATSALAQAIATEHAANTTTATGNSGIVNETMPGPEITAAINDHTDSGQATAGNETDQGDQHPADQTEQVVDFDAAATGEEKPLLKIIETPGAGNDLLFEAYHTVDYFASQGIKLSRLEADSKDKLGRQLKSFTEWLKTMKRLPQVSIDKMLSQHEESKVVEDAIHSIENKEVITEAMAEVFEKQGLTEKAVEVYQKLSLLNTAKSTYFAAKIANLKN